MGVRESSAFGGKTVNVRRLHLGRAVTANVAVAEVIGENEDDIRLLGRDAD
jgi:hypothetical protein